MAKISEVQKRQGGRAHRNPGAISWLSIAASVALYLVAVFFFVPIYKAGEVEGRREENICKAFGVEEKEEEVVLLEGDKEMNYTRQEISVSSSSGSRSITKDSVINLDQGDPTMFESFWRGMGEEGTIVIPGWQGMSYFSDVSNMCWFLEPEFAQEILRLHHLVGNAVTEDRQIIVGTGSTQLIQAALYALSPSDTPEPMSVVSAIPYYSSYPTATDYLRSGLYRWAGDANAFKGDSYIEIVCSPNNPDGFIRKAVLNSEAGKTIHDLAYYWPQYTSITGAPDHDIMLFTVSKSTGHAGTRLGWALVKDRDVAKRMIRFVELNTIGVSKVAQLRAAKILKVVSNGYELADGKPTARLFEFGRRLLAERWEKLREVSRTTGVFSLPEYPLDICKFTGEQTTAHPAFAWLKCEKDGIEDWESFLKSYKILTRSGKLFGMGTNYVRVSMLDRDETFNLFIERLASIK